MDVLLDSNVYLADVRMGGNPFAELFVYLQRTGSSLLLPHLVLEEVVSKYTKLMEEATHKAMSAHQQLWKLTDSGYREFHGPNLDSEVKRLRERMRSPSKGVKVVVVDDYSMIQVRDVVMRGVHRQRPANAVGEELRDVVIWYLVLHQAASSSSGIAFVSGDTGFMDKGRVLHPDLVAEVRSRSLRIDFYPHIRDLVVAKSLDKESITAPDFFSLIGHKKIRDTIEKAFVGLSSRVGDIVTASINELDFHSGTSYRVAQSSKFVEVALHGSAEVLVMEWVIATTMGNWLTEDSEGITFRLNSTPVPGAVQQRIEQTYVDDPVKLKLTNPISFQSFEPPKPKKYLCSFMAKITARVLEGVADSVELQEIQFRSFLPVA